MKDATRTIFLLSALLLGSPGPGAQSPAFEVASVKLNRSGVQGKLGMGFQPGRLTATNYTLKELIQTAYHVEAQIAGGPSWIDVDRFDIEAKGDFTLGGFLPGSDGKAGRAYQMLQTLLVDRFQLAVHAETRQLPIYELVMASRGRPPGPRLRRSDIDCEALLAAIAQSGRLPAPPQPGKGLPCSGRPSAGRITGNALTMAQLASTLAPYTDRAVRDRTGLAGGFDWELEWTRAPGEYGGPGPVENNERLRPDGPSLFTALQEQLGLKLVSTRGPVEVLVVDRAERPAAD